MDLHNTCITLLSEQSVAVAHNQAHYIYQVYFSSPDHKDSVSTFPDRDFTTIAGTPIGPRQSPLRLQLVFSVPSSFLLQYGTISLPLTTRPQVLTALS